MKKVRLYYYLVVLINLLEPNSTPFGFKNWLIKIDNFFIYNFVNRHICNIILYIKPYYI